MRKIFLIAAATAALALAACTPKTAVSGSDPSIRFNADGKLKIMQFLFKAVTHTYHIIVGLCIFGGAGFRCFFAQCFHFGTAYFFQTFLPGQNVHGQFFVVLQVQIIHFIQHSHIFQQCNLMSFQHIGNGIHIGFHFAVLCFQFFHLVFTLAEQTTQETFLFFGVKIHVFQFYNQSGQGISHFTQIFVSYIG